MEFIYVLNPKAAEELMAQGFGYTTSTMNGNLVWIFDYNDELQRFTIYQSILLCNGSWEKPQRLTLLKRSSG